MLDIRGSQKRVMNKAIPIYSWCLIPVFSQRNKRTNSKHVLELRKANNALSKHPPPPLEGKA